MEFSWPIFLVVLLLGILQVAMGVIIGRALPLKRRDRQRAVQRRAGHLVELAGRLFRVVNSVAEDVDRHQARIQHASHALRATQPDQSQRLAELVLRTVAELAQLNEQLQGRLAAAERKLTAQARQIEGLCLSRPTARDGAAEAPIAPGTQVPDGDARRPDDIEHACDDLRARLAEIAEKS